MVEFFFRIGLNHGRGSLTRVYEDLNTYGSFEGEVGGTPTINSYTAQG